VGLRRGLPEPARRHRHDRWAGHPHTGDPTIGATVALTACGYMLLASLAMGVANSLGLWRPRGGSVLGTIVSSLLPLVALMAAAV
jgi:putative membrane protein